MKKINSIKSQVIISFIVILTLSFMFTLFTYFMEFALIEIGVILPADYYEQKIPAVTSYINSHEDKVFNKENKDELEKHIPLQGISYAVLDNNNKRLYGTIVKLDREDIINIQNKVTETSKGSVGSQITLYMYLKSSRKNMGTIMLRYSIKPSAANPALSFLIIPDEAELILPFIYLIIFTYIITSGLSKKITKPVQELINASNKIKNKELDFELEYYEENELGELTQAFNDMRNELSMSLSRQWESEQERKEMISAITHDLRTPLTIIKGHIDVLMEDGIDNKERLERYLGTINFNIERVIKLIEEMNKLMKVEREDFNIVPAPVDLEAFIKEREEDYRVLCESKNIGFFANIHDERTEKAPVIMDRTRMLQVLDNLISNSIRYTPENGTITMDIRVQKDKINFEINDTGKGFEGKNIRKIFTKFYQEDRSRSGEKLHFGLGLYIAKCIVEKHGGAIRAKNNDSGGACVSFYISMSNKI